MRILAFDTSTELLSVALLDGDSLLHREANEPRVHAEKILPFVAELLQESGLGLSQLDGIAFGRGPGSFTSLRIGIGVVQGLALGAGLGVLPVSSLAALAAVAAKATGESRILSCIDARMGEVYCACYHMEKALQPGLLTSERVVAAKQCPLPNDGQPLFVAGSGVRSHEAELLELLGNRLAGMAADHWPQAAVVAAMAALQLQQPGAGWLPAEQAQPLYVRDQVTHQKAKPDST